MNNFGVLTIPVFVGMANFGAMPVWVGMAKF